KLVEVSDRRLLRSRTRYILSRQAMTDPDQIAPSHAEPSNQRRRKMIFRVRLLAMVLGFALLYVFYIDGIATNPPGYYVDESAISYNAYCIAKTGKNEFGSRLPLFFRVYTGG